VHYQSSDFFTDAASMLSRVRSRDIQRDVDVSDHGSGWLRPVESKGYDIGGSPMPEMPFIQSCDRPARNECNRYHRVIDAFLPQRPRGNVDSSHS